MSEHLHKELVHMVSVLLAFMWASCKLTFYVDNPNARTILWSSPEKPEKKEFVYPNKKPLALMKSKLRPIFVLRLSSGPFLCQRGYGKQINVTCLYPSIANGFDQLMVMHCFEDVSILQKVCIYLLADYFQHWDHFKIAIWSSMQKAREKWMWLSAEYTYKESKWFRHRYLGDRSRLLLRIITFWQNTEICQKE